MTKINPNSESEMTTMCTKRINALKALPPATVITIAGKTYTVPASILVYQGSIDAHTKANAARAAFTAAVAERKDIDEKCRAFDVGMRAFAATMFTPDSPEGQEFGLKKRTVKVKVETKALAAEKGRATRKARNTMGPKEKLKVKGTLPASTAPAEPAVVSNPEARHPAVAPSGNGATHG
jgi:hypothetical protein